MSEPRWDIPDNWAWVAAGDIADVVGGGTPTASDPSNFSDDGVPWLTPADLTGYKETYIGKGRRDLSDKGIRSSGATLLPEGTVLFSSRAPVGYCAIASNAISTNQGFKSFVLKGGVLPEYIRHYLLASKEYAESLASGTTFKELSGARAAQLAVPVAPLPEQRRIVAKLDQLFERTTSAREELAHIPTLVEHYKQAILRKAFSGELTKDWREKQGRAEAEVSTVGELVSDIRYGTAKKCYPEEHGVAVLRIPNVSGGQIVLSDLKYAELEERELRKLALQVGDILIVRSNGSPELVGRPALVTEQAEGLAYAGYLIRLRPNAEAIVPDYLKLMLESPQIRAVVEVAARSTSGVHNINSEELAALSIPCPETDEQLEIVRLIQAAFEWIERVSGERDKAATLLDHLDSGLLSKAFKGELVPQDPADEPAEQLLERIRSERAAQTSARRGRRTRAGA